MRDQLTQYVNLLFAGAQDADEIRAEILQNTLDRYDDLIAQGKSPEAAYRLAITGIGDISELLGKTACDNAVPVHSPKTDVAQDDDTPEKKKMRAIAIAMYILCPVPLFILSELGVATLGLCLTIGLVAAATYLMVNYGKKDTEDVDEAAPGYPHKPESDSPHANLKKSIGSFVWAVGLAIYFIVSFTTGAWFITWVIFPILGCVDGLVKAIFDLKEARDHEN